MNVNSLIISALSSLSLPVDAGVYAGSATEYIYFNYSDERPVLRADDEDLTDMTTVQVHYFTKTNPQTVKKSIQTLLRDADFTIINVQEFFESDTQYNHIVVECWIEGFI